MGRDADGRGILLEASGGVTAWLAPQVDAAAPCSFNATVTCQRIRVLFQTTALAAGTYEGDVIVTAPGAVDAPQTVSIKIYVGGNAPDRVDLYVPPVDGANDFQDFQTPQGPAPFLSSAGSFLSVTSSNLGSFRFLHTHRILGAYAPGVPMGDNDGTVFIEGSSFESDNGAVPVTLHVTTEPIADLSPETIVFRTAEGIAALNFNFSIQAGW